MDNEAFRKTYRDVNELFCVFEKSVLTNQCKCSKAQRFCIAEREGVRCRSEEARLQCMELLDLLRHQSRFTLRTTDETSSLPHAKAIRIQVGGLRGLCSVLNPDQPPPAIIEDVHGTIEAARTRFGGLDKLPFQEIIKQVAAYKGRQRGPRRDR